MSRCYNRSSEILYWRLHALAVRTSLVETHALAPVLMVHRFKLSDFARDRIIGAIRERDAQEIRSLRYSLLGRQARSCLFEDFY